MGDKSQLQGKKFLGVKKSSITTWLQKWVVELQKFFELVDFYRVLCYKTKK